MHLETSQSRPLRLESRETTSISDLILSSADVPYLGHRFPSLWPPRNPLSPPPPNSWPPKSPALPLLSSSPISPKIELTPRSLVATCAPPSADEAAPEPVANSAACSIAPEPAADSDEATLDCFRVRRVLFSSLDGSATSAIPFSLAFAAESSIVEVSWDTDSRNYKLMSRSGISCPRKLAPLPRPLESEIDWCVIIHHSKVALATNNKMIVMLAKQNKKAIEVHNPLSHTEEFSYLLTMLCVSKHIRYKTHQKTQGRDVAHETSLHRCSTVSFLLALPHPDRGMGDRRDPISDTVRR